MADVAGRRGAPAELAVAALVAAASIPLTRLFRGSGLGAAIVIALVFGIGVCWVGRRLQLSPPMTWGVSVLSLVWWVSIRYFPETLFGVFPSQRTFAAIGSAIRSGSQQIYREAVPVEVSVPLLMFVTAGIWLTVWLVHTSAVGLQNPLLGIAGAFPLFLLAGALEPSSRLWFDAGAFVAASAWLVYDAERARVSRFASGSLRAGWRPRAAVSVALTGLVASLVIGPRLPGFGGTPVLREIGEPSRVTFNPFVAIKPTLDNDQERVLFSVTTKRPTYYRLTSVERFDGKVFKPAARAVVPEEVWSGISGDPRNAVFQAFQIDALGGDWLPASYRPVEIRGIQRVRIEQETDAFLAPRGTGPGTTYQVISDVRVPTERALDSPAVYNRDELAPYLDLPKVPGELAELAREIAGDEPTPYRRATALQRHLRGFKYDEDVAAEHSFDDILTFLTEVKAGYCEQFAASMTVMARILDIPARVAIGFVKGVKVRGDTWQVSTRHAHAWPELWFPQAGWVAFEPTPRSGFASVPDYSVPDEAQGDDPQDPQSDDTATAQPSVRPTGALPEGETPTSGDTSSGTGPGLLTPLLVILVLLAVAPLVGLAFALRRRRRIDRARDPRESVTLRYADFLGWCLSAGYGRGIGETPREHARRAGSAAPQAAEPLGRLAVLVDEALYAPPNGLDPADAGRAAAEARAAMAESLPRWRRVAAALGWGRWRAG